MVGHPAFPGTPTARQAQVLAFIRAFTERQGAPPSWAELGQHFGISQAAVNTMIRKLEARGFVTRTPGATRSLEVTVPDTWLPPSEFRTFAQRPQAEGAPEGPTRTACLIIEGIVRTLAAAPDEQLWPVLRAVFDGLDKACLAGGATQRQRLDAREAALGAAIDTYQAVHLKPGKRGGWDAADIVLPALRRWPKKKTTA